MHILHINSKKEVDKIDELIKKGSDVFILVYMEGCGPCNATRPEWAKIESALKDQYSKNDKLVIIDVNKNFVLNNKYIGIIDGYPAMKYIGNNGKTIETYENSSVTKKDRSVSSFINWIESKINNTISTTPSSSPYNVYRRIVKQKKHVNKLTRNKSYRNKSSQNKKTDKNKKKSSKWTRKYKSSINCDKPKGFSQKQYCKYGRK